MKIKYYIFLLLGASAWGAPEGAHWIALDLGGRGTFQGYCASGAVIGGLDLGGWVSRRWGWDASGLFTTLKDPHGPTRDGEGHLQLSGLFDLKPGAGRWAPYLRAGAGLTRQQGLYSGRTDGATSFAAHLGAGLQYFAANGGLASLEGRAVEIQAPKANGEWMVLAGLGFHWGGVRPSVRVAPDLAPEPTPALPAEPVPPAPADSVPPALPLPDTESPAPPPPAVLPAAGTCVIHFANDSARILPKDFQTLMAMAARFKERPGVLMITVTGHTSSTGTRRHNRELSVRRAKAAARFLERLGIPGTRMVIQGLGPDDPVASNSTAEGRARNRRVVIQ